MKKVFNYSLLGLGIFLFFACGNDKKNSEIPIFDVSKDYPKKEIILQDIADVEYIPLETRDDVLLGSCRIITAGQNKFLAYDIVKGDIFLFGEEGEFLNKFNHRGQSGQEYVFISRVIVDEDKNELLVFDSGRGNMKRIQVYDFKGIYKRTITYAKDLNIYNCVSFNEKQLLCYHSPRVNIYKKTDDKQEDINKIVLLSKETGNIDTVFKLPVTKGVNDICTFTRGGREGFIVRRPQLMTKSANSFIVNEIASDTIFEIQKDKVLQPLLVRTPKVSPLDKPLKMLGVKALTSDAYYLETILKEYNPETREGFEKVNYQLQKSDNQIFEYSLKNSDVAEAERVVTLSEVSQFLVEDLKELLEEGKLSGKLKEIAENLNEDDNPVLVKLKFKE